MAQRLPKLRKDLVITRQKQRGEIIFVLKDPVTQEYFRYSESEYQVMALFDGYHTIDQIIQEFKRIDPELELDRETISEFLASLKSNGLIQRTSAEKNLILLEKQRSFRKQNLLRAKGSALYLRVPLLDPNELLNRTINYLRFFWTPSFFIFSLLAILAGYVIIAMNWDQVYQSLREMYSFSNQSSENILRLWVVIIVVIALHEFGHAYTCKNYGGDVHEMGFLLMMMINPCFYANVNDAWTFPDKSHKLWVTFAGGYFEAFIGAIATFAWWLTNPGTTFNTYCYTALTVCSVSSLAFNFNPLVKLDGYYALSDYLEIPNLRKRAGDYISYILKRYVFRKHVETEEDDFGTKRTLFIYGALSKMYITLILITVFFLVQDILIASFHEIGILILAGLLGYIFRRRLRNLGISIWRFFSVPEGQDRAKKKRNRITVIIVLFILLGFFIPKKVYIVSDCHLEPCERIVVRAHVDGFVKTVHVEEGALVEKGTTIITLENIMSDAELSRITLDRQISNIEIQRQQSNSDPSGARESEIQKKQIDQTLKTKKLVAEDQIVRSPISGTVLSPDMAELKSAYMTVGKALCEIGDLSKMSVVIPVNEDDAGLVDIGDLVKMRVLAFPGRSFTGRVISLSARINTSSNNTIQARLEIVNENGLLKTGMQGKSSIEAHQESFNAFIMRLFLKTIRMDLWF